jgi:hypothetical protein
MEQSYLYDRTERLIILFIGPHLGVTIVLVRAKGLSHFVRDLRRVLVYLYKFS